MWDLPRSAWRAGPHRAGVIATPVSRLFEHHSVTPQWIGAQAARNLQRIARERGFLDVSYSGLADRQGTTIEGRGWGRSGAHTRNFNSTSHALCLVGNFETDIVPDGMIRGMVRAVRDHRRVGPGHITHVHRQVAQTVCPGRHGVAAVPTINAAATGTPPKEEDMALSFEETKKAVRQVLNEGTAFGQTNWAGTSKATLSGVQRNANRLMALAGAVRTIDDADEQAIAEAVLDGLDPAVIAAAIPTDLAQRVADELAGRLAG